MASLDRAVFPRLGGILFHYRFYTSQQLAISRSYSKVERDMVRVRYLFKDTNDKVRGNLTH